MSLCRYRVCTKRHVVAVIAFVFLLAVLIVAMAAALPYAYSQAAASERCPITCTDRFDNVVALTVDVTANDRYIPQLIAALTATDTPAAVFVTGEWVDRFPAAAQALIEAGFPLMNLSDSYGYLSDMPFDEVLSDFSRCSDKLRALTGHAPLYCRAPRGQYTDTVLRAADTLAMPCVQWDVDGAVNAFSNPHDLAQMMAAQTATGSIVRLSADQAITVAALPLLIEQIQDKGLTFTPLADLLYPAPYAVDRYGRQRAA